LLFAVKRNQSRRFKNDLQSRDFALQTARLQRCMLFDRVRLISSAERRKNF
jgi:hypothetical protein